MDADDVPEGKVSEETRVPVEPSKLLLLSEKFAAAWSQRLALTMHTPLPLLYFPGGQSHVFVVLSRTKPFVHPTVTVVFCAVHVSDPIVKVASHSPTDGRVASPDQVPA